MRRTFLPQGVCSQRIEIEVEGGIIKEIKVEGGCNGNLKALSILLRGMQVGDAIEKLSGIRCGYKLTSCPDQIAEALKSFYNDDILRDAVGRG